MKTFWWEMRYWTVTGSFAVVALVLAPVQLLLAGIMLIWVPFPEVRRSPPLGRWVSLMGRSYEAWLRNVLGPKP